MSDEEKQQEQKQDAGASKAHGPRGEIGQATAALTIKQRWHETHFKLEDTSDREHPFRKSWVVMKGAVSLKDFARKLAKDGDQVAKDWLAHKLGSLNPKRSEKNVARIALEKSATQAARHKKKGSN